MNDSSNSSTQPSDAPNLYLIGFMGTGKSVVGRKVADALKFPFLDSDQWIEDFTGMTIPAIFEQHGEPYFRQLERKFVMEEQPRHGTVISCGGGLVTNPELRETLKSMGVVVVLYACVETLVQRIAGDANRPLMKTDDPEGHIRKLLEQREPAYKDAGVGIMTDGYSVAQVADHIVRIYLDKRSQKQPS